MEERDETLNGVYFSGSLSRPVGRALPLAPTRCARPLKTHATVEFRRGGGRLSRRQGFTLIETLVAVSLLAIAIVAPMSLVSKSLATAYYARDQITTFHLAQETIETIRHIRDHNVLLTALGTPVDLLAGIPVGQKFIVDTRNDQIWNEADWSACPGGTVPPLKTDGTFYGHGDFPCNLSEPGWTPSRFTRYAEATTVAVDENDVPQEIRITMTVSWETASQTRTITISENLYRWVNDSSAQQ